MGRDLKREGAGGAAHSCEYFQFQEILITKHLYFVTLMVKRDCIQLFKTWQVTLICGQL